MIRYLSKAFWAGSKVPGLGVIPWNVLAVAGCAILGFGEHAVWLAGLGLETVYLYSLSTNRRFQNVIDAMEMARVRSSDEVSRGTVVSTLGNEARQRLAATEKKVAEIEKLYATTPAEEDLLLDNNRDALEKLKEMYLRLLVAQKNIMQMSPSDRESIHTQIASITKSLSDEAVSPSLRQSRQATLAMLQQRLRNFARRDESLTEIESDLVRIETQIDLALEDASLKGRPSAVSSNLDFVSHLFVSDDWNVSVDATPQVEPPLH